jgi:RNA polymerase sigma-70 factor (ECF subfamily)
MSLLAVHEADDLKLIASLRAGDQSAMERLYDRYSPLIYGLCLRIVKNAADADEVTGKVFLEFWQKLDRFDQNRGNVTSYLITLTRSRCLDRLRALDRPARTLRIDQVPAPAEPMEHEFGDEQRRRVRSALDGLKDEQRSALELAYFEGLSHAEIAAKLQKPLGTVKTHIRSALTLLRRCLLADGGGGPS